MTPVTPTAIDIAGAAARISGRVRTTPLVRSDRLSRIAGAEVWLKLETTQLTGSFKIRGATNAIARLRERDPAARLVTTASAGNHGLALAKAGAEMGITVRVHLPATAPAAKKDALRRYGAVTIEAATYDEAERHAQEEVARGGVTFISAYSNSDVIAGAGTVALEMFSERPDLDLLIVPLGGGGLLSGTAIWTREHFPRTTIVGAEADASPVFTAALAAGRPVTVDVRRTVADGLAGNMEPDSQTFPIVRDRVDRVVRVPEPAIISAMADLATHEGFVAEGAAATAVGALLAGGLSAAGRHVGIILSGSNVATPYN